MDNSTVTWQSLSLQLKLVIGFALVQGPIIGCLQSNNETIDEPVTNEKVVSAVFAAPMGPDLKCLIRSAQKVKSFVCGDYQFNVVTFDEVLADSHLGGLLPENKSLESIGCQLAEGKLVCREERKIEQGRARDVVAYRSFTAFYEKLSPQVMKNSESNEQAFKKFETCIYAQADNKWDFVDDIMQCNVGQDLEMKKCLLNYGGVGPAGVASDEVMLENASKCWFNTHE